jgi:hypothetical protein
MGEILTVAERPKLLPGENGKTWKTQPSPIIEIYRGFTDSVPGAIVPRKAFVRAIRTSRVAKEPVVIVSTLCPSYTTDDAGMPDYKGLGTGISPNSERHLTALPSAIKGLKKSGVDVVHTALLADTEVDLNPFLEKKLGITPEEFTHRCQVTTGRIGERLVEEYGVTVYNHFGLPPAARFLEFFGDRWDGPYEQFKGELVAAYENDPQGPIAKKLERDYQQRRPLVRRLLGNGISEEAGIRHIARQKAQYMTVAHLLTENFGRRVLIANHRTPNNTAMNTVERRSKENIPKIGIIELIISTLPTRG